MDARPFGVLDRFPALVDVAGDGAGQAGDDRAVDFAGDALHRREIVRDWRPGSPASMTSTPSRASCCAISTFCGGVSAEAGRLLAVAQRGVEELDVVSHAACCCQS